MVVLRKYIIRLMCGRVGHFTRFECIGEVCIKSRGENGQCMVPKRLAKRRKVKVRIIHGLTLVINNSYTYCKSFISPQSKVLLCMLLGGRLVGVNHRALPTATHKEDNQRTPHVSNLLHNIYHTCMLRESQTLTQIFLLNHNYSLA